MAQLHRRFTDSQVKELLERYLRNEIQKDHIQQILGIKKRRFLHSLKGTEQPLRDFLFNIIESPKPEPYPRVLNKISLRS